MLKKVLQAKLFSIPPVLKRILSHAGNGAYVTENGPIGEFCDVSKEEFKYLVLEKIEYCNK